MYRIVRRVIHTITTVTLFIRWEDAANRKANEEEIVLPSYSSINEERTIEEISKNLNLPVKSHVQKGKKP